MQTSGGRRQERYGEGAKWPQEIKGKDCEAR